LKLVGSIDASGFVFRIPTSESEDDIGGSTIFVTGAVIAVVGFLETVAVGGKFAAKAKYEYVPNQELIALGVSNIAGSLMSGYPGTGSFTRTAVNAMFGATSLVSCLMTASIVFLAVLVLLPVISLLPLASLAPIIIQGAIGVVDLHGFRVAWRASAAEFGVMLATLVVSLALTVKEGLLVGFLLSVLKTMNDLAHPNMAVCGELPDYSFRDIRNFPQAKALPQAVVVRMDARLSFANARRMKQFCLRAVRVREAQGDRIDFVVVDGKSINHVDLTSCEMLEALAEALKSSGQSLIIANLKGPVSKCLASASVPKALARHGGHLCIDMDQAMAIVNNKDQGGTAASQQLQELVRRVETATLQLQQSHCSVLCSQVLRSSGGTPKHAAAAAAGRFRAVSL
jgi:MFS superfamily sulfate permease-like transporter